MKQKTSISCFDYDTSNRSSSNWATSSKLVFTILSAVAENERDRIRERVRDAKRHRASQLLFNGGKRPFGFDVKGEGKDKHLVPNASEQAALARGKALQSEGATLRAIASIWADELGLKKFDAN
jgi:DNA invertase Pin-like site-specific DNA recombinase